MAGAFTILSISVILFVGAKTFFGKATNQKTNPNQNTERY